MCFYIQKGNVRPKIAEKDITCYKVFDNDAKWGNQYGTFIRSLFQCFSYKIGIKYELDGYISPIKDSIGNGIIEVGLHSYTCLKHAKEKSIRLSWFNGYCCVYRCIIPKGSTYYVNTKHKEYVSDQIIIKELVK